MAGLLTVPHAPMKALRIRGFSRKLGKGPAEASIPPSLGQAFGDNFSNEAFIVVYADAIRVESNGVADTASMTIVWPYQTCLLLVLRNG